MKQKQRTERPASPALPALALILILLAGVATAGPAADPVRESVRDAHRIKVCGGGRGEVTLLVNGQQLEVTNRDGDHVTTTVIDMDQVGRLVGDAMGEAMAALEDLQLQVRVGQDNRVNITTADRVIEVDLDQIMNQVAAAVETGLEDIDTETWATNDARDEEQLQSELADLQEEMRALRAELRRLRDSAPPAPEAPPAPKAPKSPKSPKSPKDR